MKRLAKLVLCLTGTYFLIVLIGLVPVNNGFEPAEDGVEIFVASSPIHADVIVPMTNQVMDWRQEFSPKHFNRSFARKSHVGIGWGDRGFYLETPAWSDLKVRTVLKALFWPSGSCMHVTMYGRPRTSASVRSVVISEAQYALLVEQLKANFERDTANEIIPILGYAYEGGADNPYPPNGFFSATGRYHCLNTCNSWTGRTLKETGLRVPWLTPLPKTLFLYWP